jgi:ribosomal protein S18 acetylase RimI-like enzyme
MERTTTHERVTVRLAQDKDRQQIASLVHFGVWVHRHLDWRPPLDWIGYQPYLLADRAGQLVAAMTCPPDPPETAWIRLFAASSEITVADAWDILWPAAHEYLWGIKVAAIPLQGWFSRQLRAAQFDHAHDVAMLVWENQILPPASEVPDCILRLMNYDDLNQIKELDAKAFAPIWQQSIDMLEVAFQQAAIATVAETPEGIIGYQISTAGSGGGHLARLAVHPQVRGQGVGYALARDMLAQFHRRGSSCVTVNTQIDNEASMALYKKAGFRPTGEVYPIYETQLD